MSLDRLIDVVCHECQAILAREHEDGTWSVKILAEADGQWCVVNEWREQFVCWQCKAKGSVNTFDMIPTKATAGFASPPVHWCKVPSDGYRLTGGSARPARWSLGAGLRPSARRAGCGKRRGL
jgi:hypothetical protein